MKHITRSPILRVLSLVLLFALAVTFVLPMGVFAKGEEEEWEKNVLRKDPLKRMAKDEKILTVTFLDSTEDAPKDPAYLGQGKPKNVLGWIEWENGMANVFIAADGGINAKYCFELFRGCNNLVEINFNGAFHTDNATSMQGMFRSCEKLEELDLQDFNTSKVTSMSSMFYACAALEELDLTSFDTAKVTNMSSMFAGCENLVSVDVTSFDTAKVTTMAVMFRWCNALEDFDFSGWDVSKVKKYDKFMNEDMRIDGQAWEKFFQ